jgi:hypothetical protein
MVRKKNKMKRYSIHTGNFNISQPKSVSLTVTDTELRELINQGLIVDEIDEVLEYDRKSMPWVDNFIRLSRIQEKKHITP